MIEVGVNEVPSLSCESGESERGRETGQSLSFYVWIFAKLK
jgi:hypothetical protein